MSATPFPTFGSPSDDDGTSPSPPPMDLPTRVYEAETVVRAVDEKEECGILQLQLGGSSKPLLAFFMRSHCCGGRMPSLGDELLTNARLVDGGAKVPFLSAAVWRDGETLEEELMEAVMTDKAPLEELEAYARLGEYLAFTLETDTGESSGKRPRAGGEEKDGGDGERNGQRRKKVKFDDGYRSSQDKDGSGMVKEGGDTEQTTKEEEEEVEEETELVEVFPPEGVEAKLDQLLNHRIGVLTVNHPDTGRPLLVLFNITEVWVGESPFLETHSSWTLKQLLESEGGKQLRVNAREVANTFCEIPLQATAVWTSEAPPAYHRPSLLHDLGMHLRRHLFFKTGMPELRTNPLAGESEKAESGVVVEYFSQEMGFVKLDSEDGLVVLFHLNQIWEEKEKRMVLLKEVLEEPLHNLLPLGSPVMLVHRRLPAHNVSAFRCQATAVWRPLDNQQSSLELPREHLNRYASQEQRVGLMQELDHYHDCMKTLLNMHLDPANDPRFRPVQTILNGLPGDWQAQIVAGISLEFGIIQISNVDGMEFNIGPGVKYLYVMFHIEDVWDHSGVKSPTIAMPMLIDSYVDLTARPICAQASPEKVFEQQRKLMEEKLVYGELPLLQAVVVCVKRFPYDEVDVTRIPQPTILREGPGSFGLEITEFYLNPTLSHSLDLKLQRFLNIPNNLQFLYERVMRKIDLMEEQMIKAELRKIDSEHSSRWTHGQLPARLQKLPPYMVMPRNVGPIQSLRNQCVRPVFLHQRGFKTNCGVVELVINNSGKPLKTLAFFEMSQFVSFKPANLLVSDLTSMVKMPAKETFHAHLELAYPDSPIPYVILAVWNEDSRKMFGAPLPQPALNQEQPYMNPKQGRAYIDSCRETVFDILRTANMGKPAFGRGGGKRGGDLGPLLPPLPPPSPWQDILTDFYGIVLRIVNKDYGLAAGILSSGREEEAGCSPFQLIFDTCDLFVEEQSCDELGKSLADVVSVGDFIRFHGVRVEVESVQPSRNLRYMATGAVTASSVEIIKRTKLPNSAPKITLMSQLAQEKIDNFKAIAKALNTVKLDEREAEIFEKLESGELVGLKDLKKSFVTLTKEKTTLEEDDVLIKKFREQNPFEEGDETEVDTGAAKDEKGFGWSGGKTSRESKMPSSSSNWANEVVDEEILAAERALKEKALNRAKETPPPPQRPSKKAERAKAAKEIQNKETPKKDEVMEVVLDSEKPAAAESSKKPQQKEVAPEKKKEEASAGKPKSDGEVDVEKICEDLTPKQIRKLVMAYMDVVGKMPEKNPRTKIDPLAIAKNANINKDMAFLEKFFFAFAHGCRNSFKGMKFGSVFVTQGQVKAVLAKGIMGPEHILREGEVQVATEQTGDVFSDFRPDQLRKLVLGFLKVMEQKKSWGEIAKEHDISLETAQQLLVALTEKVKEVAKGDIREVVPFKLQAIFISKDWAKRIFTFDFDGKEEEIEEITLDSD